jgi:hypothetical protein
MKKTISELENLVQSYLQNLYQVMDKDFAHKPNPAKWSKKEILGHLIDSAQNNIRRFVLAQYEEKPKISYNQDKWVIAADYQHYAIADLIQLWVLLNKHICIILKAMPPGAEKRESLSDALHTIEWLAEDYIKHLKHHMHVILNLEPVAYP